MKLSKAIETELAKSKGVEIHGSRLRIRFMYRRKRQNEILPGLEVTVANVKFAVRKRSAVLHDIETNSFDYGAHFPDSPNARIYAGTKSKARTVDAAIDLWLDIKEAKCAPATFKNYKSKSNHVRNWRGHSRISDITKTELEKFQVDLIKKIGLGAKTTNDVFTIVRGIWKAAYIDGIISTNPLDTIENIDNESSHQPDPFTRNELDRIAKAKTDRVQERNMIMFACWTGLSVSEIIALAWEDIDLENWVVRVQRARVSAEYKVPKERGRVRDVHLIGPAVEWLKKQRDTYHPEFIPSQSIKIRQRNNIEFAEESVRFVFWNTHPGSPLAPFASDGGVSDRFFKTHTRRAKIRYRGANQCRHTFASQCITAGVPLEWIAQQLGHTDTSMLKKHYGKIIPDDAPNLADMVTGLLGFKKADTKKGIFNVE